MDDRFSDALCDYWKPQDGSDDSDGGSTAGQKSGGSGIGGSAGEEE